MRKIKIIGYSLFMISFFIAVYYVAIQEKTPIHLILFILAYSIIIAAIFTAMLAARKETQEALERSEKRFRALIEHSADVIVLLDTQGKILYTSPSTTDVLGYKPEELINTDGFTMIHSDDIESVRQALTALLRAPNNVERLQFRLKHKNGYWIWTEATGTNLLHDPAVGAIVLNYRDITEQRRLDQAKNEFLSITAHQLRSPLSIIRWETENILKRPHGKQAVMSEKIRSVHGKILQMISLVNNLLYVSRVISGDAPNKPASIDLVKFTKKELVEMQSFAKEKSVALTYIPPDKPLPKLFVDPQRLSAVVANVLSNAIRYSPKGKVTITFSQTEKNISMHVADTGIGVPKEEQDKIFTKFFRASNAKALETEGIGLGLFVVKSYIEDWNGRIAIDSPTLEKNRGTTIHIIFPL